MELKQAVILVNETKVKIAKHFNAHVGNVVIDVNQDPSEPQHLYVEVAYDKLAKAKYSSADFDSFCRENGFIGTIFFDWASAKFYMTIE
jgi:hypothetical protein